MKRKTGFTLCAFALGGLLCGSLWLRAQRNDARPLPELFPPGALLYLEARDLHKLVGEWNSSGEKAKWVNSANFQVLSQSRLVQRLGEAQTEFQTVAGIPVEMNLLDQVAGAQSAFAFYDLAHLSFVYLTRLDDTRLNATDLWKKRTGYQTRQVAGISFFVKEGEGEATRTIAFASYEGWLVLATDANQMARTLTLLARQPAASLATEGWFKSAVAQAPQQPGDLRLVYDLAKLAATPQFRTYWIHRNKSELQPFASGISDLFEQSTAFEERRALIRPLAATSAAPDSAALSEVLHHVPAAGSLYRAWASPDQDTLGSVLRQVVLSSTVQAESLYREAPQVTAEAGVAGSVSDLETRIDEPAYNRAQQQTIDGLRNAISALQPSALLHTQTTTLLNDKVFLTPQSEAVILCRQPIDRTAFEQALTQSAGLLKTGSLDALRITTTGNLLVLSRMPSGASAQAPTLGPGAIYAAGYNHASEWARYQSLFNDINRSAANPETPAPTNMPAFFSGNLRSLGDALSRVTKASIVTQDDQTVLRDTVRYELQ
ncbi:MAG TPA: hypothetical protein VGG97_24265 [Bryobacteraceae bacterium]|jgi:hypothetical protein